MERVLIVTATAKSGEMLSQLLKSDSHPDSITIANDGADARRRLSEADYELIIVNTPLPDEFGHDFSTLAAHDTMAGVLLIAKAEIAEEVSARVEEEGVLVLPKPLNRTAVFQALRLLGAVRKRLLRLQNENHKLHRKLEELRVIDHAKCILIELQGMTEPEAHRYIEQQAMQNRMTKRQIAQMILDGAPESD